MDLVMAPRERDVWSFRGRTPSGKLVWSTGNQLDGYRFYEVPADEFWPAPKRVEPQQTARVGGILQALLDRLFGIPRPVTADDYALAGGKGAE